MTSAARQGGRVVVWSHDPALAEACGATGADRPCQRVASAYEAAAELLAGTAGALVIDLSQLRRAHLPLLAIAREHGVEAIGVGPLGEELTSEELSGLRLAGRAELTLLVAASRAAGDPAEAADEREAGDAPPDLDAGPADAASEGAETVPPDDAQAGAAGSEARPAAGKTSRREPGAPANPSALLTAEELDALLEDES
jgi:hypothetical protein